MRKYNNIFSIIHTIKAQQLTHITVPQLLTLA